MLHAHYGGASQDCDGRYDHGFDVRVNEGETESEFEVRMFGFMFHIPDYGTVDITIDRDQAGRLAMGYSMQTDEGFSRGGLTVCADDDFDDSYSGYRDHTAERAGY